MIDHPAFPVEPWAIRETELDLDRLAQSESVFALSNGHIGLRGNLDEGEPYGLPGTYLGGFYETRPLPYAEAGYGYPEDGQSVVNVTNGKIMRLLVEDEPFDVRYGVLRSHERVLDLRAGMLRRAVHWTSPTGREIKVSSTRLVSFNQRAVAVIEYIVEPVEDEFTVVVQSELVANESMPPMTKDPRAAAALAEPLVSESYDSSGLRAILGHHTRSSGLRMAAVMEHLVEGPDGHECTCEVFPDLGRMQVTTEVSPGKPLRILKLIAYGWSAERSAPALRDQVAAAGAACAMNTSSASAATKSLRRAAKAAVIRRCFSSKGDSSSSRPAFRASFHSGGMRIASMPRAGQMTTGCWPRSEPTWIASGTGPTSRSKAIPSCSRRFASGCFTPCRRALAASSERSPPRA